MSTVKDNAENTKPVDELAGYEVVKPFNEDSIADHAGKVGGRRLLKQIFIKTDDKYCFVYLVRRPSRNLLKAIADKKKGDKVDTDAVEKLMMGLVLEGDMTTLENDGAVYSQMMMQLGSLAKAAKGEIKEA